MLNRIEHQIPQIVGRCYYEVVYIMHDDIVKSYVMFVTHWSIRGIRVIKNRMHLSIDIKC